MFRKVNDYAASQPGYAAAFPTFLQSGQFPVTSGGLTLFTNLQPHDIILIKDSAAAVAALANFLPPCGPHDLGPCARSPYLLTERESSDDRLTRFKFAEMARIDNGSAPPWKRAYVEEAFYFAPILTAMQLQARGWYVEALDWFRTIYDYVGSDSAQRWIYPLGPVVGATTYEHDALWLRDPLNPHAIAATRSNVYLRFTVMAIVRCLLEYADAEFTRDTSESVPRARTLYETALRVLETPELAQTLNGCEDEIGELVVSGVHSPSEIDVAAGGFWRTEERAPRRGDATALGSAIAKARKALTGTGPLVDRVSAALTAVKQVEGAPEPTTMREMMRDGDSQRARAHMAVERGPGGRCVATRPR